MNIDFTKSNADDAWGHFLRQHLDKSRLRDTVKSFYAPADGLQGALRALLEQRGLDTAVGVQLDGIGSIVQVSRNIPDAVYLAFFGYTTQEAGRAYSKAPYRREGEAYSASFKLGDNEYRQLIKAKIVKNNSHGTIEDIYKVVRLLFLPTAIVLTEGAGTVSLNISVASLNPLNNYYQKFIPKPAGITLSVAFTVPA